MSASQVARCTFAPSVQLESYKTIQVIGYTMELQKVTKAALRAALTLC